MNSIADHRIGMRNNSGKKFEQKFSEPLSLASFLRLTHVPLEKLYYNGTTWNSLCCLAGAEKEKTSILNPIQHIKLNQQLTTVTEEIEELKSMKEQLIFQAECSTDKDMTNLSKKYDQMNNNLDILDSQDISLKKQLEKDAAAFREEKFRPEPEQYTELLDTRIQIRPDFRDKLIEQLKGTFGKYYDYHRRDIAANEVDYLNVEDPDVFSHRAWELEYQRKQEIRRNQLAWTKKMSYDMEL